MRTVSFFASGLRQFQSLNPLWENKVELLSNDLGNGHSREKRSVSEILKRGKPFASSVGTELTTYSAYYLF